MRLHHYGFATTNIREASNYYEILGYKKKGEIIADPIQNVKLLFLQKDSTPMLELVEPLSDQSPVSKLLKRNGSTLYHCCYETDHIKDSIEYLKGKGFINVVKPVGAVAFENRLISFLYHQHLGLIELLQTEP